MSSLADRASLAARAWRYLAGGLEVEVLIHVNPQYRKVISWIMRCMSNVGNEFMVRAFHTQPDFESQRLAHMNTWKATTGLSNQWSGRYDEPTSEAVQGNYLQKLPKEAAKTQADLVVTSMTMNQGLSPEMEAVLLQLPSSLLLIRTPPSQHL